MKKVLVILFALSLVSAKTNNPLPISLQVARFNGTAHVCPTGPREAFTAAHVVILRPGDPEVMIIPLYWAGGVLGATKWNRTLDVARVEVTEGREFPKFYPISPVDAKIGDKVYVTGYNYGKGLTPSTTETKIIAMVAGRILVMDKTAGEGSSGSCIFNMNEEVVGINNKFVVTNINTYGLGTPLTAQLVEELRKVD